MSRAAIGIAVVAVHAAAFVAVEARSGGTELAVELAAPQSVEGRVPDALASRVNVTTEPGPLARRRWSVTYRGGYQRVVGASALVGPFQSGTPCSGRVIVGQQLLDEAGGALARLVGDELHGQRFFPVGDFVRVDSVKLRFAQLEVHLLDRAWVGDAPHGYIRATAELVFSRVRIPVVLALVPGARGHFRIAARAEVELDSQVLQWFSDELGGDRLATRLARRDLDGAFATALAPPPPLELGDGQQLQFDYCDGPLVITEGAYGVLPFAVVAHGAVAKVADPAWPEPRAGGSLALELDANALDAMLFELWRTGWLDRRLAEVGLDRRFAEDPTVAQFLSVRISPPRLALPPVIAPTPRGLRLAADARIELRDGSTSTTGRVYGALDFTFAAGRALAVDLGALELACERTPTTLVPCYADLVAAIRDRGGDFHGALTDALGQLVSRIFDGRRVGADQVPAELAIRKAMPSLAGSIVHVELDATIVTK